MLHDVMWWKRKKQKTNIAALAAVGIFGIAAAIFILVESHRPLPPPSAPLLALTPSQFTRVPLDFGDGTKREFRGVVAPNMSALDALSISTEVGGIRLSTIPVKDGVQVAMIGGKKADKRKQWIFYVNGKSGQDPATYQVGAGDEIEWKYQQGSL